jgi:soluble cytochrome b562
MRAYARLLLASAVAVALGVWAFTAAGPGKAADEPKEAQKAVEKITETVAKGDMDAAKKQAAEAAKKTEIADFMELFKLRAKGGLGVGPAAGAITPDGVEAQVMALAKKAPAGGALAKQAPDLEKMANTIYAVSLVTEAHTPKKAPAGKNIQTWKDAVKDMQESSQELAKAAKANNAAGIKAAATKLNAACNNCHVDFRD